MTIETMIRGLKFTKFKGSEESGHHGHAGRPGSVGGSAPGSGTSFGAAGPIVMMMSLEQAHQKLKVDLIQSKELMWKFEKGYAKNPSEEMRKALEKSTQRKQELEKVLQENEDALKGHKKTIAPGAGDWIYDGEESKRASLSMVRASIYQHPEYGSVNKTIFVGMERQRTPATATVTYTFPGSPPYAKHWSGPNSQHQAEIFLRKHWGIR